MIYIKRLNLVFIKIPKNASTAISNLLLDTLITTEDVFTATADKSFNLADMKSQNLSEKYAKQSHITYKQAVIYNLIPTTVDCYGVFRNPLERLLSLYVYRLQQKMYGNILPSVSHFKSKILDGVYQDFVRQQTPQYQFLEGSKANWMLYDTLATDIKAFAYKYKIDASQLARVNVSAGDKQQLVSKYFDNELLDAVHRTYEQDFKLYEELKNARKTRLED